MKKVRIEIAENAFDHLLYVNGKLVSGTPSVGDEFAVAMFKVPLADLRSALEIESAKDLVMQMLHEFEHEQLIEHGSFALSSSQKKEIAKRVVKIFEGKPERKRK